MKYTKITIKLLILSLFLGATSLDAFGFLGFGNSVSWKEEVLLHDGKKIVVERSQSYGGRHEIGQSSPIKEQDITFSLPGTNKTISWTSEYSKDVGRANFELLALHILKGIPYIVASPRLCLSYNKWGRPNPPYVIFKYNTSEWQRIPLEELPAEFTTLNLTIETKGYETELVGPKIVPAEMVKKLNGSLRQPEYQAILREAIPNQGTSCGEMISDGNNGWIGIGWFTKQPSYEACLKICKQNKMSQQYCPCDKIFNKSNAER